jgi:hypothetical protein
MSNEDHAAAIEQYVRDLPGGTGFCKGLRTTAPAWQAIATKLFYCCGFPDEAFGELAADGTFDVRWPLSFAACYFGLSGAHIDEACETFLLHRGFWEEAVKVLPEYRCDEWVTDWRKGFQRRWWRAEDEGNGGER